MLVKFFFWKPLKDIFSIKSPTVIPITVFFYKRRCLMRIKQINTFSSNLDVDNYGVKLPDMYTLCENVSVKEQDIIDKDKILRSNQAIRPDAINHYRQMLTSTLHTIVKFYAFLKNLSLNDCIFPCTWKIANVLQITNLKCKIVDLFGF